MVVSKASGEQKVAQLQSWVGPPEKYSWKVDAATGLLLAVVKDPLKLKLLIRTRIEVLSRRGLLSNCKIWDCEGVCSGTSNQDSRKRIGRATFDRGRVGFAAQRN